MSQDIHEPVSVLNLKSNFSLNPIAQKTNKILDKMLPYEARAEFRQIFCSFLGQCSFKKVAFEIYKPLA